MISKLIATLGTSLMMLGFAPAIYAQTTIPSSADTGNVTLSGESLQNLESRSIQESYSTFSGEASSNRSVTGNANGVDANPLPRTWELTDQVQVVVDEPPAADVAITPLFINEAVAAEESEIKLQYQFIDE